MQRINKVNPLLKKKIVPVRRTISANGEITAVKQNNKDVYHDRRFLSGTSINSKTGV